MVKVDVMVLSDIIMELAFPAEIGRYGFASPCEPTSHRPAHINETPTDFCISLFVSNVDYIILHIYILCRFAL